MNSGKNENAAYDRAANSEAKEEKCLNGINHTIPDSPIFFKLIDVYGLHRNRLPHAPGIYAMMENERIIYIGSAVDLARRIYKHTQENSKDSPFSITVKKLFPACLFWEVCIVPIDTDIKSIRWIEEQLIKDFSPLHNRAHFRKSWDTPTMVQELF